jgi:endonuclease/exonuclease/phosphatase family metal-dependent hydrolase
MRMSARTIPVSAASILVALFCLTASARADDRRLDKSRLSIMQLNAEFLWDGQDPEEGQADFPWKGSPTECEEHMRRVSELILKADPDIVNLCEVENLDSLTLFNDHFLAGRGYAPYLVKGTDSFTGQDVCLLTRIDPEGGAIRRDDRAGTSGNITKNVSKNYIARIDVAPDLKIALVGIHLLAIPPEESRRLPRQAQADAVRSIALDELHAGFQVVVIGDFNDYDGSQEAMDHIGSQPITTVLSSIRAMDPADPADDLVSAASRLDQSLRWTAFYDANRNGSVDPPLEFTSIDHVLLSPALAQKIETVAIPHEHDPRLVTDHFPVVVWFRLRAAAGPAAPGLRIAELLPNPPGDESKNESVTLSNGGATAIPLAGWKLRDAANTEWLLDAQDGTVPAGGRTDVLRRSRKMTLNNGGDTVELIDPQGHVVQRMSYGRCDEGEIVTTQP